MSRSPPKNPDITPRRKSNTARRISITTMHHLIVLHTQSPANYRLMDLSSAVVLMGYLILMLYIVEPLVYPTLRGKWRDLNPGGSNSPLGDAAGPGFPFKGPSNLKMKRSTISRERLTILFDDQVNYKNFGVVVLRCAAWHNSRLSVNGIAPDLANPNGET